MLFSFEQKHLHYAKQSILKNLTLSINEGEKVAIIGESGAGKSTLLKALREQQASKIAWCPQDPGLVPMLSALHNIYMGQLHLHPFLINLKQLIHPNQSIKTAIEGIADSLGIQPQLYQACEQLSGGQQQRVSIGRAFYSQQSVFLGDEPVSALDEYQANEILALIVEHFNTLIISLHDTTLALRYCQRIIALKDGCILFDKPSHDITPDELVQVYS